MTAFLSIYVTTDFTSSCMIWLLVIASQLAQDITRFDCADHNLQDKEVNNQTLQMGWRQARGKERLLNISLEYKNNFVITILNHFCLCFYHRLQHLEFTSILAQGVSLRKNSNLNRSLENGGRSVV